jgi:hypothetical protein
MRTTDLFTFNRSAKRLNESLAKTFGRKLNLETFTIEQLEDARNKLRTQIYTARSSSNFNETVENDTLSKAQFMHDAIVAELSERDEPIVDNTVQEGPSPEVEEFLTKVANDPQAGYDMLYDAQMGKFGKEIERVIQDMYDDVTIDTGYHGDDDFEQIYDRMLDNIESDYADKDVKESAMSEIAIELAQVADDEDYDKLYDLLSDPGPVGQYLQDKIDEITGETGLHAKDDIEKIEPMLMDIVQQEFGGQNDDEGGDTDDGYALASAGHGSDEDYGSFNQGEAYDMDQVRADAAAGVKKSIDKQSDDRMAKLKSDKNKGFMAKVGDKIIGGVKGAARGFAGKEGVQTELSTNTLKSYQDKAGKDIVNTMTSGDYMTTDKSAKKVMNRMKGSEKADNKIWKRENESIQRTQGESMSNLREGEIQQASAIVTAKTMVDRVGRWIEELSGMENDTLLQLGDSIRDEMGQEQAKQFISTVAPAIQSALENLKQARETLSGGVRTLTGEEQPAEMLGGDPAADMAAPAEPDAMNAEPGADMGADMGGDDFDAAEPAAGGIGDAGREQRESIDRQSRLLKVLAG